MFIGIFDIYSALLALSLLAAVVWSGMRCVRSLHMLQLDSFSNIRLCKWLWTTPRHRLLEPWSGLLSVGLFGVHLILWALEVEQGASLILGAWCLAGTLL